MPSLVLTPGDPTGIGPEITAKALRRLDAFPAGTRLTVIGSLKALEDAARLLGVELPRHDNVRYLTVEAEQPGAVAYHAVEDAVRRIAGGEAEALVTGPISKRNLAMAGYPYTGHTEILEELANLYFPRAEPTPFKAEMLFVHRALRLLLLTRHIPLRDVSTALAQPDAVSRPLDTLIGFLREKAEIATPRLAILGVNPHAGETGGADEREIFLPLREEINRSGLAMCEGPFAADAFFRGFDASHCAYDAIVAAYHDQGLIPFKLLAGMDAVNMTIGLPFIRTSVGHGTADDIAGRGIAREASLMAALAQALGRVSG